MFKAYEKYWKNFAKFTGRSPRSDYWWVFLVNSIITFVLMMIMSIMPSPGLRIFVLVIVGLWILANIVPLLALIVRRLRDANHPWGFIFFGLIPTIGGVAILCFMLEGSKDGKHNTSVE